METIPEKELSRRSQGRLAACEIILFSQFGKREYAVSEQVAKEIRRMDAAAGLEVHAHAGITNGRPRLFLRPAWALAAAASVLLAAGLWWVWEGQGPGVDVVAVKHGTVGQRAALRVGDEIRPGERVTTAVGGYAKLALKDGSTVEMNGGATLMVNRTGRSKDLTLEDGDVLVRAKNALRFNRGRYDEARNMATVFELSRNQGGMTTIRVVEGQVRFGARRGGVTVDAQYASSVMPGGKPSAPEPIGLGDVALWAKAPGAGNIYDDSFTSRQLASLWAKANPSEKVTAGDNLLTMVAGPAARNGSIPARTELISKPVMLDGRSVEFTLIRNKKDGAFVFLPLDGQPVLAAELIDQSGEPICRLTWNTFQRKDGTLGTMYVFAVGKEPPRNIYGLPTTTRVLVDSDGRVVLGKGVYTLQGVGSVNRRIESVSLRLSLSNPGAKEVKARWTRMTIQQWEKWPDWVEHPEYQSGD